MEKEKILLDTDIGSDIDDAVCLAYLLAQPRCDLLGITTVTGEPLKRAMLASAILRAAGRDDIPVVCGSDLPLVRGVASQPEVPQFLNIGTWPHREQFPQGAAVEFMRKTIRSHPGEVTLLAIGPLTNVALLFKADQEIPKLLKRLVMMCGVFDHRVGTMEWNAMLDPWASAIVYGADVAVHRSIGLDVTTKVTMDSAEVRSHFTSPILAPVLDFAKVWFEQSKLMTFHDPLAAVTIFDDSICRFERGDVDVELQSARLAGMTHYKANADRLREVAVEVDPVRFFEHYFSVFNG